MRGMNPGRLAGAGSPFNWPASIGYARQPYASFPAGPWRCIAGPEGVALGIFGWVDPNTHEVSNVQTEGAHLVFVLPVVGMWNWNRCYPNRVAPCGPPQIILRAGLEVVPAVQGDFLTRFPLGAQAGARVWTDPATGLAYDANLTGGYIATPWTVITNCGCNGLARISSFTAPVN